MNQDEADTGDEEAGQMIKILVWSGFYDRDEMIEIICDNFVEPGEIEEARAEALIDEEITRKSAAEKSWEAETDCDRLDRAFERLNEAGIIALHNAGYTQSDGISDVSDVYHQLEDNGKTANVVGYCFYHEQDTERAVRGGGLMLAFGEINGEQEKAVEIGRKICEQLRKANLSFAWNETVRERVHLDKIVWHRRAPVT